MGYKIYFAMLVVFMIILNVMPVQANSAAPLYAIVVEIEGCTYENRETFNNIDVLFDKTSYNDSNVSETVNNDFLNYHPDYSNYDYMNDTSSNWISYGAYYKDAEIQYDGCYLELVNSLTFDLPILEIKIVNFNDLGETIFLSEIVDINPELANSRIEGSILFNPITFEITDTMEEYKPSSVFDNLELLVMAIFASLLFIPILILISSLTETILSIFFKFNNISKLSIFILNIFTQFLMYFAFSISNLPYYLSLVIIEIVIYSIEYLILINVFKEESNRKILYFVIVANTATLLLGHLLSLY